MAEAAGAPPILLARLRSVSPSSAELLRLCPLRAILAGSRGTEPFVLGNPKAWLGTAYHRVMEGIASAAQRGDPASGARMLWDDAVRELWQDAQSHPLNHRFGPPETWPGYHLALAGAMLHCQEISPGQHLDAPGREGWHPDQILREQYLTAMAGKLVGRPDRVARREVTDYKSGGIYEDRSATEVKASYIRQLRLYAYLVRQNYGYWPEKGVLVPMLGAKVEIELAPSACESEAAEAVSLLGAANAMLPSAGDAARLANPSPKSCGYCPYKIICPVFWQAAQPEWSGPLRQACLEGRLTAPPSTVHGGAAASVEIDVDRGAAPEGHEVIAPLSSRIHPCLAGDWHEGERVRFTGLALRPDGRPGTCSLTVCARVRDLPELRVAPADADSLAVSPDGA
ncbi:MAG TPA: hypothetical protein DCX07_09700 [Phycisphaerales bacterium]|nr:hypothetical protein [Phycisphaerales bacterium]